MRVVELKGEAALNESLWRLTDAKAAAVNAVEERTKGRMSHVSKAVTRVRRATSISVGSDAFDTVSGGTVARLYGGRRILRRYREGDFKVSLVLQDDSKANPQEKTLVKKRGDVLSITPAEGFLDLLAPSTQTKKLWRRRPYTLFVNMGGDIVNSEDVSYGNGRRSSSRKSLAESSTEVQKAILAAAAREVFRAAGVLELIPRVGEAPWYRDIDTTIYPQTSTSPHSSTLKR